MDVYGTSLKLSEYFAWIENDFGLALNVLNEFSMYFAVALCAIEIAVGVMLLYGVFRKVSAIATLLIIIPFTILTSIMAFSFSGVNDCGCFGDAIKISNEATFIKNILLLFLSGINIFFVFKYKQKNLLYEKWMLLYIIVFSVAVPLYAAVFLPAYDFLQFNRGANLKTNEDFTIYSKDIVNVKDSFFNYEDVLIAVITQNKLEFAEVKQIDKLSKLNKNRYAKICVLSSVAQPEIEDTELYYVDGVTLKSMIRATNGIILILNGTIAGKWKFNNFKIKEYNQKEIERIAKNQKCLPYIYFTTIIVVLVIGYVIKLYCDKKQKT